MKTDITELAQSKALHKKLNRRLNDAFGFQRTSGGKHTTISLSIDECKSVIAAFDECLALVEALEKAQQRIDELENDEVFQRLANAEHQLYMAELAKNNLRASRKAQFRKRKAAEQRIAELDSRTVTVKLPRPGFIIVSGERVGVYMKADVDAAMLAAGIEETE